MSLLLLWRQWIGRGTTHVMFACAGDIEEMFVFCGCRQIRERTRCLFSLPIRCLFAATRQEAGAANLNQERPEDDKSHGPLTFFAVVEGLGSAGGVRVGGVSIESTWNTSKEKGRCVSGRVFDGFQTIFLRPLNNR